MKIISKADAMRIHRANPGTRCWKWCTGKYKWHGTAAHYLGREVDAKGVLAVYIERRQDSDGAYALIMCVDPD